MCVDFLIFFVFFFWKRFTLKKKNNSQTWFWRRIWAFPKLGVPQNGWFIRENPIRIDDWGKTHYFWKHRTWKSRISQHFIRSETQRGSEFCECDFFPDAVSGIFVTRLNLEYQATTKKFQYRYIRELVGGYVGASFRKTETSCTHLADVLPEIKIASGSGVIIGHQATDPQHAVEMSPKLPMAFDRIKVRFLQKWGPLWWFLTKKGCNKKMSWQTFGFCKFRCFSRKRTPTYGFFFTRWA